MKKEDAASYASGLLIGADVRIGLSAPIGAQITIVGRPDLTESLCGGGGQADRKAIESTASDASSPGCGKSQRGSHDADATCCTTISANARWSRSSAASRPMRPRRSARRSTMRHPHHRGAVEFARPAGKHRALAKQLRGGGVGRRRHGARPSESAGCAMPAGGSSFRPIPMSR